MKESRVKLKSIITFCLSIFTINVCVAYTFSEHQHAGDKAMNLFFMQNNSFANTIFAQYIPIVFDNQSQSYIFKDLSIHHFPVSYGTINGLSGDHAEHPLLLEQQLLTQNSNLIKVIAAHAQYQNRGFSTAPISNLMKANPNFSYLAINSLSHFHAYGKGLQGNIEDFDVQNIEKIINPSLIGATFKKLNASNSINMYITLHTAAIYLAEIAGIKAKNNDVAAKKYLYYSFLYNGFADHFLEDCFCSGHLLVKRSVITSAINNKPLHDFYNVYGTDVVNIRGEIWKEYGDGFYNQYHNEYAKTDSLEKINYPVETKETKRIIDAVNHSISELYDAFNRGFEQNSNLMLITKRIPTESNEARSVFFVNNFKVLHIIPLPYNTDLNTFMPDSLANNEEIKETNKTPYYRNFIKSRIANSVIAGSNTGLAGDKTTSYSNLYIRLNVGLIKSKYEFNDYNTKKGKVDVWHGYTASYTFGEFQQENEDFIWKNWIVKGGIRSNYDIWLSNRRFLGMYMYNEIGMERRNNVNSFVYSPQIGIQLGSLLKINYYNMPAWLRIPAQLILPLSLHAGCIYSVKNKPLYFFGSEINFVF